MLDLFEMIGKANEIEIEQLIKAVLQRYTVLFPGWELSIISLRKDVDKNTQIDEMIELLEKMKENKKNLRRP